MIALFDSGYGGLTVLKPILKLLPEYDYLYLGDSGRAPYGNHSTKNIKIFSDQAVEYLFSKGAKLIIFACNTASSTSLSYVQQKYLKGKDEKDRKILGVLIPAVEKAIEVTKNKRVGIIGTKATINSKVYETEIHKLNKDIKVYGKACPLLVPLIEEGWQNKPESHSILKKYLRDIKNNNVDTLILGCTHYPLMLKNFKRILGKKIRIIESGSATAQSLKTYLERHPEIEKRLSKKGKKEFLTTDDPQRFKEFTEKYLGMKIKMPEKVTL